MKASSMRGKDEKEGANSIITITHKRAREHALYRLLHTTFDIFGAGLNG